MNRVNRLALALFLTVIPGNLYGIRNILQPEEITSYEIGMRLVFIIPWGLLLWAPWREDE